MEKYIGSKIKEKRKNQNLTIANLSIKTGLSESLISRVEKGNVVPSINTLRKLARGLNVSITEFFMDEKDLSEDRLVVRSEERKKLVIPGSDADYEILTPDPNKRLELLQVKIAPNCREEKLIRLGYEGEECMLVLEGEIKVDLGDKEIYLKEGDCIYFTSSYLESVNNLRDEKATVILAVAQA